MVSVETIFTIRTLQFLMSVHKFTVLGIVFAMKKNMVYSTRERHREREKAIFLQMFLVFPNYGHISYTQVVFLFDFTKTTTTTTTSANKRAYIINLCKSAMVIAIYNKF